MSTPMAVTATAAADSSIAATASSLLSPPQEVLSLADEVTAEIFSFLDALDTVQCSMVCRNWRSVVNNSRSLWRQFTYDDYGFCQGDESADWKAVYAYIYRQEQYYLRLRSEQGQHIITSGGGYGEGFYPFLQSRLVFSDDGSPQPGNDPENALQLSHVEACWCTNAFVDKDVDLVADLTAPHLVMAFCIANGGRRFSAPVKEALAFASMDLPDLEQARAFDGDRGKAWIHLRDSRQQQQKATTRQSQQKQQPLAGFAFPDIPNAYNSRLVQPCTRPTVARYVHFKLLSSSKCTNRVSNNIDVRDLHTYGVSLPRLPELVKQKQSVAPDPASRAVNYQRRYEIREYPWHLHDAFHRQQEERMLETIQFMRERLWQVDRERHQQQQQQQRQQRGRGVNGNDANDGELGNIDWMMELPAEQEFLWSDDDEEDDDDDEEE